MIIIKFYLRLQSQHESISEDIENEPEDQINQSQDSTIFKFDEPIQDVKLADTKDKPTHKSVKSLDKCADDEIFVVDDIHNDDEEKGKLDHLKQISKDDFFEIKDEKSSKDLAKENINNEVKVICTTIEHDIKEDDHKTVENDIKDNNSTSKSNISATFDIEVIDEELIENNAIANDYKEPYIDQAQNTEDISDKVKDTKDNIEDSIDNVSTKVEEEEEKTEWEIKAELRKRELMSLLGETKNILENINYSPKSSSSVKTYAMKTASLLESMEHNNTLDDLTDTSESNDPIDESSKTESNKESSESSTTLESSEKYENSEEIFVLDDHSKDSDSSIEDASNTQQNIDGISPKSDENIEIQEDYSGDEYIDCLYEKAEVIDDVIDKEEYRTNDSNEEIKLYLDEEPCTQFNCDTFDLIPKDQAKTEVTLLTLETDRFLRIIPEEENIDDPKPAESEVDEINAPDVKINAPEFKINAPDVKINAPEFKINAPDVKINAPDVKINMPDVKMNMPDFKKNAPEVIPEVKINPVRKSSSIERGSKSSLVMMKQLGKMF